MTWFSKIRRCASIIFIRCFGAKAHEAFYKYLQLICSGCWRQIWRFRNTPENPNRVKLAACVIVKNEAPYIAEWIEFHRAVGVQKFYFYLNDCTDNSLQVIRPYIDSGLVEYVVFNGEFKQVPAYQDCLDMHHADADWLAFIDIDEFLVPVSSTSVVEILSTVPSGCDQVLAKWLFFGSAGHEKITPGLVIERFTMRGEFSGLDWQTKAIVRPRNVYRLNVHRHLVMGETIRMELSKLRVHHYFCKSLDEYALRSSRGDVFWGQKKGAAKYSRKLFDERDLNDVEDRSALRFRQQMNNCRLCSFSGQ